MIVLEVHIFQLRVWLVEHGILVEPLRDVTLSVQVLWSYLGNVHVNHVTVEPVDVKHLVLVVTVNVNRMLYVEVLVGQDHIRMAVFVARGSHVVDFEVPVLF